MADLELLFLITAWPGEDLTLSRLSYHFNSLMLFALTISCSTERLLLVICGTRPLCCPTLAVDLEEAVCALSSLLLLKTVIPGSPKPWWLPRKDSNLLLLLSWCFWWSIFYWTKRRCALGDRLLSSFLGDEFAGSSIAFETSSLSNMQRRWLNTRHLTCLAYSLSKASSISRLFWLGFLSMISLLIVWLFWRLLDDWLEWWRFFS